MHYKRWSILAILILALFILECATVRVSVSYDESVDFSQYQTFYFARSKYKSVTSSAVRNPLFTQEVFAELRPILAQKGFTEVTDIKVADLVIHFYAFVENRQDYIPPTYRVGRWGHRHVAPGRVVRYKEGNLVIDVVNRLSQELIWQGIGQGVLDRHNPRRDLIAAASNILVQFPPIK
jgi:hypothetical protein